MSTAETLSVELRKNNVRGKVQVWRAEVSNGVAVYDYGQEEGKMQQTQRVYDSGKQKRNAAQQAVFDTLSIARKKMRTGYVGDVPGLAERSTAPAPLVVVQQSDTGAADLGEEAGAEDEAGRRPRLPMLAQDIGKHVAKLTPSLFVQPKLDGIRCLANTRTGELWSRSRKQMREIPHISEAVRALGGDEWLDGELYNHGDGFQTISSLVKQPRDATARIRLHVYDVVKRCSFEERVRLLHSLVGEESSAGVCLVDTRRVGKEELDTVHEQMIGGGYEGTMVRLDVPTEYESGKRSTTLLKRKDSLQEEFRCTGMVAQKHTGGEKLGSVTLRDAEDREFNARPAMSEEARAEIWATRDTYNGQWATVRFFAYTDNGIPRFPRIVGFRAEDDM
jgi:ATP-dependent DNA ligase